MALQQSSLSARSRISLECWVTGRVSLTFQWLRHLLLISYLYLFIPSFYLLHCKFKESHSFEFQRFLKFEVAPQFLSLQAPTLAPRCNRLNLAIPGLLLPIHQGFHWVLFQFSRNTFERGILFELQFLFQYSLQLSSSPFRKVSKL